MDKKLLVKQYIELLVLECFDHEEFIIGKEEEAGTLSLSSLKIVHGHEVGSRLQTIKHH